MYKIIVCITTYNRPESLALLLNDIKQYNCSVYIFDDGSYNPHPEAIKYEHHGKKNYYKLITKVFEFLKEKEFDYFFLLPDDIRLKPDFFELSLSHWNLISKKICLSVGHTHNRHLSPCWTQFKPIPLGDVVWTQWNDLCFMAERKFLDELDYKIEQPLPGYNYASSGVGRYISKTLNTKGFHMYHTNESLVEFPAIESKMHV